MGSPRLALVGAFVIGGLLIFAVGLFMIGDRRLLFSEQFEMEADFGNVAGVEIGTSVRLSGLPAGEVIGIDIPDAPGGRFLVRMRVREDLHALVRTDSEAAILSDGLLGSAFIQLRAGSDAASLVPDGGELRGIDAVEIADLIAEGRETFRIAANEMVAMRAELTETFNGFADTIESTTRLVDGIGTDAQRVTDASARLVDETRGVVAEVRTVLSTVRTGQDAVESVLTETEGTIRAVRQSAEYVEDAIERFSGPDSATQRLLVEAGEVMSRAREAMGDVADNTEALKRNWLFRGFFAERGFYNLDELTVAEYRTLLRDDRYAPLRIWLAADRLFESSAGGGPTLRDGAARRIEEAMGELLQYPRASPIVVEGYATDGEIGRRLLAAHARAELVERYLVRTFRRAGATGTMALGAEAAESPSGDGRWDGVALTLFADPEALARGAVRAAR
jgi:phospholipid/cholesterol/gamma-HCH transport system substrate-binding protein